ncbi:MAG: beta-glucosidase [Chitinophagaceae bacterium]|nr:beta-glucosidase [Chitinophagaceae bacterium]
MELRRDDFGKDFKWGVSSAAYQIEGAHLKNGKGLSIWDEFTSRKGKILNNENANIACDFYNNYHQDLALMRSMNIPCYRFSISWSRIFPDGTGQANKEGVDFYKRVIDFCLELEIEPWITLYHWDLPLELEKKGGWANREIVNWFSDYVSFCIRTFGDKVKYWMVLNEPMVFTGAGYFLGIHAPGRKGLKSFLAAVHHASLCQAEGARIIKSINGNLKVGSTFSCSHIDPLTQDEPDLIAAVKVDALLNRLFIEPLVGKGYPVHELKILQRMEPFIKDGDEKKLAFNLDFTGIQNYTREVVTHSYLTPLLQARIVKAPARKVETTSMKWEVYPESIYMMLRKYGNYKNIKEIIITENGAAFPDQVENGTVNDVKRKQYLQHYLAQVLKAKREGVRVNGYFVWTFMDNFEWAEGYHPRFGLVHVDFATQKRIIKHSGYWYSNFLKQVTSKNSDQMSARKLRADFPLL